MHHALAARAAGFCYVNDAVLAIRRLVEQGHRVAYVDIDAHHGDGVQWAFFETDKVLTISLHQHPATPFPGHRLPGGDGPGGGAGLRGEPAPVDRHRRRRVHRQLRGGVCLPCWRPTSRTTWSPSWGVDTFLNDPLANLNLTTSGLRPRGAPLQGAGLGAAGSCWAGGGYNMINVARAWTLAWAIISGQEERVPEELPEEFVRAATA